MTERELTSFDRSKLPNLIEGSMENPILCPVCSSRDIATIHNSTALLNNGGVEVYFHIYCNACWAEFPMLLEIHPKETFCTCSTCNKLWEGKERHEL